jgi:hypothetical protein
MKDFNVKEAVKDIKNYNEKSELHSFAGTVGDEVGKVEIKYNIETKGHKFQDGETGDVLQKMTIEIDFSNTLIQPHSEFESTFIHPIIETIANEITGNWENAE